MLGQMRLLAEPFAALGAWVRARFYVNAAVLQQRRLLLKLFLANGASHVEWHSSPAKHVRQLAAFEVLEREASAEHSMVQPLGILEVGRVLRGVARREARAAMLAAYLRVAVLRLNLLLVLVGRVRHVLRPQRRRRAVLENEVR